MFLGGGLTPVRCLGESMRPALEPGDFLLKTSGAPLAENARGAIVCFRDPRSTSGRFLLKRVVGLPGESIRASNAVFINGLLQEEPYVETTNLSSNVQARGVNQISSGTYFVMGDNRLESTDSRMFGAISASEIIGTIKFRYWPFSRIGRL